MGMEKVVVVEAMVRSGEEEGEEGRKRLARLRELEQRMAARVKAILEEQKVRSRCRRYDTRV
jgi:hypothetical protein